MTGFSSKKVVCFETSNSLIYVSKPDLEKLFFKIEKQEKIHLCGVKDEEDTILYKKILNFQLDTFYLNETDKYFSSSNCDQFSTTLRYFLLNGKAKVFDKISNKYLPAIFIKKGKSNQFGKREYYFFNKKDKVPFFSFTLESYDIAISENHLKL